MRQHFLKPTLLALSALAMSGLVPALADAQDRPAQDRPDDHHAMRADDHRDDHKTDDPVERYRHDHPHSSARCHDGFFTSTRDRNRACTKHGGIDVWLQT